MHSNPRMPSIPLHGQSTFMQSYLRCLTNNEVKGQPLARVQVWSNKSIFSLADHESALYRAKRPSLWVWEWERYRPITVHSKSFHPTTLPYKHCLSGSLIWRSNYVGTYDPSSPKKKNLQPKKKPSLSVWCVHTHALSFSKKRGEREKKVEERKAQAPLCQAARTE